jgi:hypothetical protein
MLFLYNKVIKRVMQTDLEGGVTKVNLLLNTRRCNLYKLVSYYWYKDMNLETSILKLPLILNIFVTEIHKHTYYRLINKCKISVAVINFTLPNYLWQQMVSKLYIFLHSKSIDYNIDTFNIYEHCNW